MLGEPVRSERRRHREHALPAVALTAGAARKAATEPRGLHGSYGVVRAGSRSRRTCLRLLRGAGRGRRRLIVMEPLPVLPNGGVTPQNYRYDDERFVPALRRVVDAVHEHGTVFVSQLYHLGANADPLAGDSERWAPGAGLAPGGPMASGQWTTRTSRCSSTATSRQPVLRSLPAPMASSACSPTTRSSTSFSPRSESPERRLRRRARGPRAPRARDSAGAARRGRHRASPRDHRHRGDGGVRGSGRPSLG